MNIIILTERLRSVRGGRKIETIKTYRKHKIDNGEDCGLKEAKDYIDKVSIKLGLINNEEIYNYITTNRKHIQSLQLRWFHIVLFLCLIYVI